MAFSLSDVLRWFQGGEKKEKPVFKSDQEAFEFCRVAYKKSGGVPAELRRSYEFYLKNFNDNCEPSVRPLRNID